MKLIFFLFTTGMIDR